MRFPLPQPPVSADHSRFSTSFLSSALRIGFRSSTGALIALVSALALARPALAHHAMGNTTPNSFAEGLVSGLAHPIIGLDHLAFVVAVSFLSLSQSLGLRLPIVFMGLAMAGTGLHVMGWSLPGAEGGVMLSVVLVGWLLTGHRQPQPWLLAGLSALAGLFHGYAYGESIVGAETTALFAYLLGFTAMQLAIAAGLMGFGQGLLRWVAAIGGADRSSATGLHAVGWLTCGIGLTLLVSSLMDTLLPTL